MQPFTVVERHDIVSYVQFAIGVVGVSALPNALHLQIQEEASGNGIVPTISLPTHAAGEPVLGQQGLVLCAAILASSTEMDDEARSGSPLLDRDTQGVTDRTGSHVRRHGTPHYLGREQVEHHRQVKAASTGSDVGDVGYVRHICCRRFKPASQHIWCHKHVMLAVGVHVNLCFHTGLSQARRMRRRTLWRPISKPPCLSTAISLPLP